MGEMTLHENPATERLQLMLTWMKKKSSVKVLRRGLAEILKCSPSGCKEFKHTFGKNKWSGIIYQQRNSIYGTIFSFWNRRPLIIRGMPKIDYAEAAELLDKEGIAEEKIDGTNLILWLFPDNTTFLGKTREVERYDGQGWEGRKWHELLFATGEVEKLIALCREGYQVIVELYGCDNPGEFIRYTVPIAIKVLEITDAKSYRFLDYQRKATLCAKHDLPVALPMFTGLLSPKKLEQLEFEARTYVKEDGMEGFVFKYFGPDQDIHMGKIKCEELREKSYLMSPRSKIPKVFIAKAIRKANENHVDLSSEDAVTFVKQELLEDFEQKFVDISDKNIRKMLLQSHESNVGQSYELKPILDYFEELNKNVPVVINNKAKVLSVASHKFPMIQAGKLYSAFCIYISKEVKP